MAWLSRMGLSAGRFLCSTSVAVEVPKPRQRATVATSSATRCRSSASLDSSAQAGSMLRSSRAPFSTTIAQTWKAAHSNLRLRAVARVPDLSVARSRAACGRRGKGGHHVSHIKHHRGGRYTMNAPASITITPVCVADLLAEGERMPVYVHVIDHPDARVLVDTGMTELHPAVADLDPRLRPLSKQDFDLAGIDIVVNTHLHFDHCGGNHLFAGRPIYVQRRELDDARSEDDYTIREWVEAPGVRYVPVDGELELLPGLRLVPAPGHTRGMQVVVVETGGRPVVVGGDVAVWFGELDEPHTEGQLRVRALDPELVWLAHEHEPWRPRTI